MCNKFDCFLEVGEMSEGQTFVVWTNIVLTNVTLTIILQSKGRAQKNEIFH